MPDQGHVKPTQKPIIKIKTIPEYHTLPLSQIKKLQRASPGSTLCTSLSNVIADLGLKIAQTDNNGVRVIIQAVIRYLSTENPHTDLFIATVIALPMSFSTS